MTQEVTDLRQIRIDKLNELMAAGKNPYVIDKYPRDSFAKDILENFEEYEGKLRYKVGFINPYDYEGGGGVVRSDAQGVKKLQSRLGTKLRALSGGSNVAPPKPAAPAPPAPPAAPAAVTEAQAWEMFYAKAKEVGLSDDQAGALFLREKQTGRSLADLASYSFEELPF